MSVEFVDVLNGPRTGEADSGYEDRLSAGTSSGSGDGGLDRHRVAIPMSATAGDGGRYETSRDETEDAPPDRGGFAPRSAIQDDLNSVRLRLWRELANDLDRIEVARDVMGGEPVVRGTTITVAQIQQLAARGLDIPRITAEFYGSIEAEDVRQAFQFATRLTA